MFTIRRILDGVLSKNLQATILFVDFTKAFDAIHRDKIGQFLLDYGLPKETIVAIMMLYSNTEVKVRSLDGDIQLRHRSRSSTRRHTSPIPINHLSRLRTKNIYQLNQRKRFQVNKSKKQKVSRKNNYRLRQ